MNRSHIYSLLISLGFVSGAVAQVQQPPDQQPPDQQPSDPRPSTSETEGTAADRTSPDQTPTRPAQPGQTEVDPRRPAQPGQTEVDPRPSTSQTEGTAADKTPPGRTPTTSDTATAPGTQRGELVGASVVTKSDARIGKVVDVVFESTGQPAFVVISSQGGAAAVPYSVASSMKSGDKIVIDEARLQGAPKIKDGEWRSQSNSAWKRDATRYWERG
jgi:rRNA processing protein Gar1